MEAIAISKSEAFERLRYTGVGGTDGSPMHLFLVAFLLLVAMPGAPSSVLVTTSKALVTTSDALVPSNSEELEWVLSSRRPRQLQLQQRSSAESWSNQSKDELHVMQQNSNKCASCSILVSGQEYFDWCTPSAEQGCLLQERYQEGRMLRN